ncbi:rCG63618 [Rattus norvegicus]|uniref:RCG63618 n=1 Tax=Rattus norvegicus TaxID=10116 RepID=A6IR45_RAT|nr:rCG63618 [Rattus norvegicus]
MITVFSPSTPPSSFLFLFPSGSILFLYLMIRKERAS